MSSTPSSFESTPADWQTSARTRIRAMLAAKQTRFAELDEQILERAEEAAASLQRQMSQQFELQSQRDVSQRQDALLTRLLEQVESLQTGLSQQREIVADQSVGPELIAEIQQLEERRRELDLKDSQLHRQQAALDHRERETELQRKNISRQLWARKAELLAEVERMRADVAVVNSGQEIQSQVRLAEELARTERLQVEIRRVEQQCDDARKLITDLRSDLERERSLAREQDGRRRELEDERVQLTAEVERLRGDAFAATNGQELQTQVRLAEEVTRTERMQAELGRLEQQCAESRQLIADLRHDLERERTLARDHETRRRELEDERVLVTSEIERLRVLSESATLEKAKLEEELRYSREETERKVTDLRADQGRAFDEHLHQLFSQIDTLTADRQRLQEEQREVREILRAEEQTTLQLRAELSRLQDELASTLEAGAIERRSFAEERQEFAARLAQQCTQSDASSLVDDELAASLRQEVSELRRQCQQLEMQLADARELSSTSVAGDEDLQRRLQMALDEVREAKHKNQELTAQLAEKSRAMVGAISSGNYDWEEQKRRLLEQLESDFDEANPQEKTDKLTVAGAIRITDQVVAEKDREIDELQKLLENQSNNIGDMAVGAAGIMQLLESDDLIMQERKHLQEIKEELQSKLRTAEIEMSVERAKLARERQDLEERLRTLEHERVKQGIIENGNGVPVAKANRGAWLTRLGLKDERK